MRGIRVAIWDRLKVREEAKSNIKLEEITPPVDDVLLKALLGSETITREKALTLPAVAGAVDFISNAVACMPVKLYQEKDGKVEEVKDDKRTKLLNGDTGDTLDAYQMKKAMVTDYLMGKGGYCYIRKSRNEVTGLFYVKDIYVSILREFEPVIKKDYQFLVEGKTYRPYEFVKILRNTKDGAEGIGLTEEISKELETAYQTLLYQLGMVRSGGNKRGFLKADRKLGQEEIDVLKTAWKNMYGNNTESVVVLNNGLQFQEASNSSVEMQMNESKRTMSDEIYDLFHIYPNDFDRTFKEAIYPIVKAFETALNRDLLLEKEKASYFYEFDVKEIIKASLNERYSAYKTAKETGFMTLNEIRRAENLNWIDGLDVVNVGLGAVLYDVEEKKYFTPNTGEATDIESATQKKTEDMIEAHEEVEAFDESGNSAERELRFNENHDPKTGKFTSGLSGMAVSQSWEEFKDNMNNRDVVAMMVQNGIKSPKALRDYWVQQRRDSFTENDIKELSQEEAVQIVRDKMPENIRNGWFVNADSRYKEPIESIILENNDVRNAGLNIAYYNAKDAGSTQDFKSFVNTEQTMYRGDRGQSAIDADVFMSYTLSNKVAQGFGENIKEAKIKPVETYGSYQTTGEQEILVPRDVLDKRELRYNENHDPKTGRFAPKSGGGNEARIAEIEAEMSKLSFFGAQGDRRRKLAEELNQLKERKPARPVQDLTALKAKQQAQVNEEDYMMNHRPTKTGVTADNLVNKDAELTMPDDVYEKPERYFATSPKATQESMQVLNSVRGKPDATVTVYRATVGDSINDGDWVTLSKSYAEEHNSHSLNGGGNILAKEVSVKDIQWAGDDINEWGYFPTKEAK